MTARRLVRRPALKCVNCATRMLMGLLEFAGVKEYRIKEAAESSDSMMASRSKR